MSADPKLSIHELDVRPFFAEGRPPLGAIMEAVHTLPPGGCLRLIAPFEPTPLLHRLGEQGFDHETTFRDDGAVEVLFTPRRRVEAEPLVLDLRDLEPPEPMQRALEALELLPAGAGMIALTRFRPVHLLEILDERGISTDAEEQPDGSWATLVAKPAESAS